MLEKFSRIVLDGDFDFFLRVLEQLSLISYLNSVRNRFCSKDPKRPFKPNYQIPWFRPLSVPNPAGEMVRSGWSRCGVEQDVGRYAFQAPAPVFPRIC